MIIYKITFKKHLKIHEYYIIDFDTLLLFIKQFHKYKVIKIERVEI